MDGCGGFSVDDIRRNDAGRPVIVFRWSAFGEGEVWEINCSEENVNRTWMPQPSADPLSGEPAAFVEPFLAWWIMNVEKVRDDGATSRADAAPRRVALTETERAKVVATMDMNDNSTSRMVTVHDLAGASHAVRPVRPDAGAPR